MRLIAGADVLEHRIHADRRGLLGAFEECDTFPFRLARVFFMKVDDPDVERGGHANSCDEFIVPLAGSAEIEVDNGFERANVRMADQSRGLWVLPGVLIRLHAFEPGTILLVLASARYEETRHFSTPQPQLIFMDQHA